MTQTTSHRNPSPRWLWFLILVLGAGCIFGWRLGRMPDAGASPRREPARQVEGGQVATSGKFTPSVPPVVKTAASAEELRSAAHLRQLSQDEWQIGLIRLNKRLRSIALPARVAEKERALEYALVHETGKVHEALFSTAASLQDLHVAALLLDGMDQAPRIEVSWKKHGGDARLSMQELIRVKEAAVDEAWRYTGSEFSHGGFAAAREGSVIALMHDPAALVNHPAAGALMKDDVFFAETSKLPPDGSQVTITLIFPSLP